MTDIFVVNSRCEHFTGIRPPVPSPLWQPECKEVSSQTKDNNKNNNSNNKRGCAAMIRDDTAGADGERGLETSVMTRGWSSLHDDHDRCKYSAVTGSAPCHSAVKTCHHQLQ